jgi:endonuclease I/chitodextrinase
MKIKILFLSLFVSIIAFGQEAYYNNVDLTAEGINLKEKLATKTISAHTNLLVYTPGVWEALKVTDLNPENSSEVLLIYGYSSSGTTARSRNKNENGGGQGDWNREHTYPKSLGNPALGSTGPGADSHHLRPSDVGYNTQRGNLKFVDGSGNSGSTSGGWYPGDEWKGDVARMMMYMYLRYGDRCKPNVVGVGSSSATPDDMIDLFLKWNVEDPVSDFERQRNTYHDSQQTYAQGNRNPFIDNAYLATRIWGGTPAEDSWGIYSSNDNQAPTVPTNVSLSNITTASINVSWTAATDNVAVTKYEVYTNGNLHGETNTTNYTATGLNSNTTYAITVSAKDIANNQSAQSTAVNGTTLSDSTPPSVPTNLSVSNETGTSFKVNWTSSTDNTAVVGYDIFVDGTLKGSSETSSYTVSGLTISTTYSITVLAKDSANNKSAQSTAVSATTTDGTNSVVELFFSEYVEGSSNNKAIEIANLTDNPIDLSAYSIKKQSNGAGSWVNELPLSGTINVNDVFVTIHFQADNATLLAEADIIAPEGSEYGAPINFNGNDPVGLFKNDVLIDIIGVLGITTKDYENMTLRRKISVTQPSTSFTSSEWEELAQNTVDGIGFHGDTASTNDYLKEGFTVFPNPTNGNTIYIKTTESSTLNIYNILGQIVKSATITRGKNSIDISNLSKGVFIVRMHSGRTTFSKKLIKN